MIEDNGLLLFMYRTRNNNGCRTTGEWVGGINGIQVYGCGRTKRWYVSTHNNKFMQKDKHHHPQDPNQGHRPIHLHPLVIV